MTHQNSENFRFNIPLSPNKIRCGLYEELYEIKETFKHELCEQSFCLISWMNYFTEKKNIKFLIKCMNKCKIELDKDFTEEIIKNDNFLKNINYSLSEF